MYASARGVPGALSMFVRRTQSAPEREARSVVVGPLVSTPATR